MRLGTTSSSDQVVMALFFFPRGGAAHVARDLARRLPAAGWTVRLASGSVGAPGQLTHAATFFSQPDLVAVDYTAAARGPDPLSAALPFQPSFEDRPDGPDRVFAEVGKAAFERLVAAWQQALAYAGTARADVLHCHHLTPVNEAAVRSFPQVPVVGHVHGTELELLRRIAGGPPPHWRFAADWAGRMRRWAAACERLLVPSSDTARDASDLLGVGRDRMELVPGGIDLALFDRKPLAAERRAELWRRWLPGQDHAPFERGGPVILYAGRFTAVKRVPLLVRAYARARPAFRARAPLVLVGGFPGEVEGRHPLETAREQRVRDVYVAGWRPRELMAAAFNAGDLLVLPSVREGFGQVVIEAMACGLPVIAARAGGPAEVVENGRTGWLVEPDDEASLAAALVEAVNDPRKRVTMGAAAYAASRTRYGLDTVTAGVADVYRRAGRQPVPSGVRDGPT